METLPEKFARNWADRMKVGRAEGFRPHPSDVRAVTASNRDRLIGIARAVAAITEPMDLGGSK